MSALILAVLVGNSVATAQGTGDSACAERERAFHVDTYQGQIGELSQPFGLITPPSLEKRADIEVRIWVFGVLAYVSDVLEIRRDSAGLTATYVRWWDSGKDLAEDLLKSFKSGDYCTDLAAMAGYYRCRTVVPVADFVTVLNSALASASAVPDFEDAPLFMPEECTPCEGCIWVSIDEGPHMAIEVFDATGHRLWGDCLGPIPVRDAFPALEEARIAVSRRYDPPMR